MVGCRNLWNILFIVCLSCKCDLGQTTKTGDRGIKQGDLRIEHEVFDGEHLLEIMTNASSPDVVTIDTIVVVHSPDMRDRLDDYGITLQGLPSSRYMHILFHDTSSPHHLWYKSLPEYDIVRTYAIDDSPVSLSFLTGSNAAQPVTRWSPADDVTFSEWVWRMSGRGVTITNRYKGPITIQIHNQGKTQPPEVSERSFRLRSGESRTLIAYISQVISAETVEKDVYEDEVLFLGAWDVTSVLEIEVKLPSRRAMVDLTSFLTRLESQGELAGGYLRRCSIAFLRRAKIPLMVDQLTEDGYERLKIPDQLYQKLLKHYRDYYYLREAQNPQHTGIANQFEVGTYEVPLNNAFRRDIGDFFGPLLADWSNEELQITAIEGINIYQKGNAVKCHVDEVETTGVAAILVIDFDLGESGTNWPLEIIKFNGDREQIYLNPGEMLLYESARLVKGRPSPFTGKSYADIRVHYQPVNWRFTNRGAVHEGIGTDQFYETYFPLHSVLTEGVGGKGLPEMFGEIEEGDTGSGRHEEL